MQIARRWWEFAAVHDAPCEFGQGHQVILGIAAYSLLEAQREIQLRWPEHIINLHPRTGY